jgi:membrane protein
MLSHWGGMLWQTVLDWWEDKAPRLGAALAYYTVLALAPVVILFTPVAGRLFGQDPTEARQEIVGEMAKLVGKKGEEAVRAVLLNAQTNVARNPAARVITFVILLIGASGVFVELQDALDTIWEVTPKPGRAAVWSFVRQRLLSFAMVLGIGFLLVVSLLLTAGLAALEDYARGGPREEEALFWRVLEQAVSFVLITLLFAMIFKVLPDVNLQWRDVWVGAMITSLLFGLGRWLIGAYLGQASVGAGYGAAGSLVVLLVWVYYSAQILLLGAEFTKVYSKRSGSKVTPTADAVPVTEEARAQVGITKKEVVEAVKEVVERKEAEQGERPEQSGPGA